MCSSHHTSRTILGFAVVTVVTLFFVVAFTDAGKIDTANGTNTNNTNSTPVLDPCNDTTSFRCDSGHCMPKSFYCDGEKDCSDGSDEISEDCAKIKKCVGLFHCASDDCLDHTLVCDGKVDCLDGWSDEVCISTSTFDAISTTNSTASTNATFNATTNSTTHDHMSWIHVIEPEDCHKEEGKFICKSGDMCIDAIHVCDKKADCLDQSDEFSGCEKSCVNSTCSQGCIPDPTLSAVGSGFCYCYKGYTPSHRHRGKCDDIDECQIFGACSQMCVNFMGSFQCSCMPGFRLKDNSSCELIDDNPALVFAQHAAVRVNKRIHDHAHYYSLVEKSGSPVSVSYDARNNWVYWSDVMKNEEAIWRSKLNGSQREKLVTIGLNLPEGIAFDWIANNIYFTDSDASHIVVCNGNGGNCSVVIAGLSKPRDIALNPNLGYMYWTDWGMSPSIMKAGMDGTLPHVIIQKNIKWPNGITVDLGNSRIYWTDAGTDRIETANLDGEDRLVVHSTGVKHPFGIDVLGDYVYWSDWNLYEIQRCHKFDGSSHETLVKEKFEQLNGVAVFHKANQPISRKNHCKDAECSHVCTLSPNNSFLCMCPTGLTLDRRDKRTCRGNYEKNSVFPKDKSKGKRKKPSGLDRETRLDHSFEDASEKVEPVVLESDKDDIHEGAHPFAIALGIIILLVLVAVIIAIVLHRRNVHPKVLVRPYVQHWVRYVNQPVQRFFDNRGEQLDGKKRIYDEVYHSPTAAEHNTYSRAYENIDNDSSAHVYEDPGDSHRITYSQTDKLL